MSRSATPVAPSAEVSLAGRLLILVTAFLGWMLAGLIMSIMPLAGRQATQSFLGTGNEGLVGAWFSYYTCAFLLGAAAGGLMFGWIGDRIGRSRAMGLSILCFSVFTGASTYVQTPIQLLVLRFLACLGVGGMWPNGVALMSEAWSNVSRPILAGLIGAAANVGFMLLSYLAMLHPITPDDWRWVMVVGATPALLGLFVLVAVPESPQWLESGRQRVAQNASSPVSEVFRPPLLKFTLLGICLGTIPLMGNWGGANWMVPWANKAAESLDAAPGAPAEWSNSFRDWLGWILWLKGASLEASTQWSKSFGGTVGALLGGWVATLLGRRTTYFTISLLSLVISLYIFRYLQPNDPSFLYWAFAIGFFGTLYFGWLPLFLPELFPTRVRATGTGVSFNFGRIATAFGVLGTGALMRALDGDYARVGQLTTLVYILGMVVVFFTPDTTNKTLEE